MRRTVATLSAVLALSACASSPNSISPQYVSPIIYANFSCEQIQQEMMRISARVSEVAGHQRRAATNDAIATGVGLVIFWPALFFLATDNDRREELSRLRGEHEALQQAGTVKNCFAAAASTATAAAPTVTLPAPDATPVQQPQPEDQAGGD